MIRTAFAIWGTLFRGMMIASALYVTVEGIFPYVERRVGPLPTPKHLITIVAEELSAAWRWRI